MKAVILAGGLGTRLKPFTEIIPKPLLPLGEKSVMEIQISSLKQHGFNDIYVATNYMSEYIEAFLGNGSKYGVNLIFSKETKPLGTCGPLSLLKNELNEPFVLMNGDILTKLNLSDFYQHSIKNDSFLTIGTKIISTPFRFGNVKTDSNGFVIDIEEKPELSFEILAGIYLMKPQIFENIPNNEYFGIDNLIKNLLTKKEKISKYQIKEYWLDIGQIEDYSKAKEEVINNF
ncbi:MAG: sugar phosphate nucleotidyltransferase [Candidatus Shapirobacteria bacterium]|nr:sugar phosphate nucleotidyltransferase [Candidatus Shapirobacteria bacterium]MDD3002703.1 sugar phosphate nucleotidyltransferase [Candidatus Shapirobacteria bacterium]MDD4383218.1 sugar phosphate nucleotidyltransferase [Candidatus Shapirobacteria bacterium]